MHVVWNLNCLARSGNREITWKSRAGSVILEREKIEWRQPEQKWLDIEVVIIFITVAMSPNSSWCYWFDIIGQGDFRCDDSGPGTDDINGCITRSTIPFTLVCSVKLRPKQKKTFIQEKYIYGRLWITHEERLLTLRSMDLSMRSWMQLKKNVVPV